MLETLNISETNGQKWSETLTCQNVTAVGGEAGSLYILFRKLVTSLKPMVGIDYNLSGMNTICQGCLLRDPIQKSGNKFDP